MKKLAFALVLAALAGPGFAKDTKTYQVTGPVLEVGDGTVTVQKGKERWEMALPADATVTGGELKKGEKVTIQYRMTAVSAEVKGAKAAKAAKTKKK